MPRLDGYEQRQQEHGDHRQKDNPDDVFRHEADQYSD